MLSRNNMGSNHPLQLLQTMLLSQQELQALTAPMVSESDLTLPEDILPQRVRDHRWFDEKNRQRLVTQLEGLEAAHRHGITKQVELYLAEIEDILDLDTADRAFWLITTGTSYHDAFRHSLPDPIRTKTFSVPVRTYQRTRAGSRVERVEERFKFVPLDDYQGKVPVQALWAMELLHANNIKADRWLVGDKVEKVTPIRTRTNLRTNRRSRSSKLPDPVLACSFGCHVVGVAEWD